MCVLHPKTIKEELGDAPNGEDEVERFRSMIKDNPYPQNVKDKLTEELARYEMMPSTSPEANVVRTYLDWMTKLPWFEMTASVQSTYVLVQFLH